MNENSKRFILGYSHLFHLRDVLENADVAENTKASY